MVELAYHYRCKFSIFSQNGRQKRKERSRSRQRGSPWFGGRYVFYKNYRKDFCRTVKYGVCVCADILSASEATLLGLPSFELYVGEGRRNSGSLQLQLRFYHRNRHNETELETRYHHRQFCIHASSEPYHQASSYTTQAFSFPNGTWLVASFM